MPPLEMKLSAVVVIRDGRAVLGPLDLVLRPGEFLTVVGPNGAGKSTLLAVLAGSLPPSSGTIGPPSREGNRRPAVLLQHHDFVPAIPFTVADVVGFANPAGLPGKELARVMDLTGVARLADRPYRDLSGGERRRVQLARLMAQSADMLLLDEPTAGLDPASQEGLLDLIDRLHASTGRTVVQVTHQIERVSPRCTSVALLAQGRLLAHGPPARVFTDELLSKLYGIPMAVVSRGGRTGALPLAFPGRLGSP